jgi:hypothetical protein
MSDFPEDDPLSEHPPGPRQGSCEDAIPEDAVPEDAIAQEVIHEHAVADSLDPTPLTAHAFVQADSASPAAAIPPVDYAGSELPIFHSFTEPEQPPPPARIPHLGHFLLLLVVLAIGFVGAVVVVLIALHFHVHGVSTLEGTKTDIYYTLGSEGLGYLFTVLGCMAVFPLLWHKSLFAGIQWNGASAIRLRWRLVSAAFVCLLLALLNSVVLPGPAHAPIEDIFREPGAAWLLAIFGVTVAPFFEEMFFRGFLLPALCTAYDWCAEKMYDVPRRPLAENGHPQWSFPAMAIAAVVTSIPFAGMHAAQTGYSIGPFLLLVGVSIVLCGVRLWTRSLASSTLVHASYNFMLFSIMLIGTHGFRHLDKL